MYHSPSGGSRATVEATLSASYYSDISVIPANRPVFNNFFMLFSFPCHLNFSVSCDLWGEKKPSNGNARNKCPKDKSLLESKRFKLKRRFRSKFTHFWDQKTSVRKIRKRNSFDICYKEGKYWTASYIANIYLALKISIQGKGCQQYQELKFKCIFIKTFIAFRCQNKVLSLLCM